MFWVLHCDVCYDFCIKMMFGSSLPPVFYVICVCPTPIVLCFCFLRLVCHVLPVTLDCQSLVLSLIFVMVCELFEESDSTQVFFYCSLISTTITMREGDDSNSINRFSPTLFLCLSKARTWVSIIIRHGLFHLQWVEVRGDCSFCWYFFSFHKRVYLKESCDILFI